MPVPIENSIRKQNIKFLHHRSQFSLEYFSFIRKLVTCNAPSITRNSVIDKLVSGICKFDNSVFLFYFNFSESGCRTTVNVVHSVGISILVPHRFSHQEEPSRSRS